MDVLAVPPAVASLTDADEWRFATLAHLLASADLTIVSIWSPTFLISLLDAIPGLAEPLVRAICDGMTGIAADPARAKCIDDGAGAKPHRYRATLATARHGERLGRRRVATLCTAAGRRCCPHSVLQPKGLLATEGAVTTNFCLSWPVPALTSAVLEFVDEADTPHWCDELQVGASYRVIMTHHGGFYRYDLGDRLCCRGHAGPLPMLEFVGREVMQRSCRRKAQRSFHQRGIKSGRRRRLPRTASGRRGRSMSSWSNRGARLPATGRSACRRTPVRQPAICLCPPHRPTRAVVMRKRGRSVRPLYARRALSRPAAFRRQTADPDRRCADLCSDDKSSGKPEFRTTGRHSCTA